jgi:hypothetical protein
MIETIHFTNDSKNTNMLPKDGTNSIRLRLIVTTPLLLASVGVAQKPAADTWAPLRYLVGSWEGTGNGQPGLSKVQREYRLVLEDKFLHVQNRSV